ncbi:luc7-like protein 3 [Prorops nasuta]|uniref:luc7-like protein 3 n=1 Tax=Prorops nasuta TaxID=863751 RepID=UPI0034CF9A65
MARYSSESDSDSCSRYRKKHYRKSRSSSSDSSDTSPHRRRFAKHSKSKRKYRSRSRSRGRDKSKNYKLPHHSSKDRDRRKYRSRKSRSPSIEKSRKKYRSTSRDKSRSRSSSSPSNVKNYTSEKCANLMLKDDFQIEPRLKDCIIDEINAEGFIPKQFSSSSQSKDSKLKNIVIDITADTIHIPTVPCKTNHPDSIFHSSILQDQDIKFDKWVKKLYGIRQKAILDMTQSNVT